RWNWCRASCPTPADWSTPPPDSAARRPDEQARLTEEQPLPPGDRRQPCRLCAIESLAEPGGGDHADPGVKGLLAQPAGAPPDRTDRAHEARLWPGRVPSPEDERARQVGRWWPRGHCEPIDHDPA